MLFAMIDLFLEPAAYLCLWRDGELYIEPAADHAASASDAEVSIAA